MRTSIVLVFIYFAALTASIFGQTAEEMKTAGDLEQAARKAYLSKAFADYLANMEKANKLRPNHPRLIYNLASAYAVNGRDGDALNTLDRLARMGLGFAVEKDEDFKALAGVPKFKDLQKTFAANRGTTGGSERAFELADASPLITEGVAHDPKTGSFYVSSVHQRKILRVNKDGSYAEFSKGSDGLWGVFGIRVDAPRRQLWVTTMAAPAMQGYSGSDRGRSGIFRYDLETGRLLKKYLLPAGERHALGDLELDAAGRIYASDSAAPVIYMIDPKADEIEEFVRSDGFASLQGIAVGPGGKSLFAADYSKGIFRIDTASKQITQLKPADDITLLGIDGLYSYGPGGDLIAIQNGIDPNRVVHFSISGDRIYRYRTLAAGHPDHIEPTLGVLSGDSFYYIANSQWPLVGEKGEVDPAKFKHPVVLKIDLKRALAK